MSHIVQTICGTPSFELVRCSYFYGAPTSSASTSITLRATLESETADLVINFVPSFSLSGTLFSSGIVGGAYSSSLTANGGIPALIWSISEGELPPGLSIDSSTGAITGTPTLAGSYTFTVKVTDSEANERTSQQSIQVYDSLSVTTSSLAATTVGASYSQTLASSGGTTPKSWSLAVGLLPAGLTLNPSTGAITGTPTTSGTAAFTVQVACCDSATAQKELSITVNPAPEITTTSLPDGVLGLAYLQAVLAANGTAPFTWSISEGALPDGLSINPSTGVISGIPERVGTPTFTVQVADNAGITDTQEISLQILGGPTITTTALDPITAGQTVSVTLQQTDGADPIVWSISAGVLPSGLTLNPSTGEISGTTYEDGLFSFTVHALDANTLEDTQELTWTVNPYPHITTSSLPETTVGAAYSQALAATGGTGALTWSIAQGGLPAGLSLNPSTGALTGTSTAAGTATFTPKITDANGVESTLIVDCLDDLQLIVNPAPSVTTTTLLDAPVTVAYSQPLAAAGGTGALTWSILSGELPAGLSLDPSTGVISGTPTTAGSASFTVQVIDTLSVSGSQALSIEVLGGPVITTISFPPITVGQNVSAALAHTDGTSPFTWSISAGALPDGLSLTAETGAITGAPTTAATASFTARIVDAHTLEDTQELTWTVNPAPEILTTSLPETTLGAAYSQILTATGGTVGVGVLGSAGAPSGLTWSISEGALPDGLSLDPSAGAVTGTSTTAGTASFTAKVTDTNGVEATRALSITVHPPPSVTTTSLLLGVTTVAYSQTLSSSGGVGAHTWSILSGALPLGLTLEPSTGAITGTPTTVGSASFTVQVEDALGITGTQALSIEIFDHPQITTTSLAPVTVGQSVSASVTATNGASPYAWAVVSGALPAGITLNPATGALTGTPTSAGTPAFTVQVTDAHDLTDSQELTWAVNPAPQITTTSLPETTVGAAYVQVLAATGGTVGGGGTGGTGGAGGAGGSGFASGLIWSISAGALPAGISLDPSSGALTGTSTEAGLASFTAKVTDNNGVEATQELSITVNPASTVTTTSLPDAPVTLPYLQMLASSGGTGAHTWAVIAGALPAGLTLDPSTGAISGSPTTAGTANFTVQVTDSLGITGTQALSINVLSMPVITTTSFSPVTVGQSVSTLLANSDGTSPFTWSISSGALPAGLSLEPSTGAISGSPTTAETTTFTARVVDANTLEDTQALIWTVNPAPEILTTSLPETTIGAAYTQLLAATGGTIHSVGAGGAGTLSGLTWSISAGALPAGISLDPSSGALTGTSTEAGLASFTAKVTDNNGVQATQELSITVNPAPTVTTTTLPFGVTTLAYSQILASAGGTGAHTWSVISGALPPGLTLDPSSGAITGTPATTGNFSFTAQVADSLGVTGTMELPIDVFDHPEITTTSLPEITVGQSVSTSVSATNGTAPYAWAVIAGALPAGVSLDPATGALTGTPTDAGAPAFTVQVTDAHDLTDSEPLTWTVNPAPEITTTSLPETTVGAAFAQTLAATGGTGALTWSISAGALPVGLSLNPATGEITGTSTTAETASFTAKVTDANSVEATQALAITVNPAPSVTTTSLPYGVTTLAYSQTLVSAGGTGAITWSVLSGALPAGLELDPSTGAVTGTPTAVGTASFTVQVTDTLGITGSQALAIDIFDHPQVTTTTLSDLTVGQTVSDALAGSHGTTPFEWSVISGALPIGLTLEPSTGAITGAPTDAGGAAFTVQVTDAHDLTATGELSWTVNPAPAITTSVLPETTINRPLEPLTFVGTGGTGSLTWGASGLPCGVSLDGNGLFSGVPLESGVFTVDITATDENGVQATKQLVLTINPPPSITTTSLPRGTVGVELTQPLASTGGTGGHDWSITAGGLPDGLALSPDGVISGVPTTVQVSGFTVQVTDQAGATGTQPLTLEIVDPIEITTTSLPDITVGQPINVTLTSTGGVPPHTWAVTAGSLPSGVTLDPATGVLSGAATDSAGSSFTVQASDVDGRTATRILNWGVHPPVQITTTALPTATVGGSYNYTLASIGGTAPVKWSATGLPAGVTLDADTGTLNGSFPTAGDIVITFTATDANAETDTVALTVVVSPELIILTDVIPTLERGKHVKVQLESSGGLAPLVWSGGAPSGMQMRADGALLGTPTAAGTFTIFIGVKDANNHYVERSYDVVVEEKVGFRVSPTLLTFQAVEGGPAPAPQQVTVTSTPANQSFTAQPDAPWLTVSPQGNTPAVLDVAVDPTGLAPGDHLATIDLPEAGKVVDVVLTVTPDVGETLTVSPGALTITAEPGGAVQARLALVRTMGAPGAVAVTPDPSLPWLSVQSRTVTDPTGLQAVLTIAADPSGLADGVYQGVIGVTAGSLSFDLPVQVDVAAAQFELSHTGMTFEAMAGGANPPTQRLRVLNMSALPLDWLAAADAPWAAATPPSGIANPVSDLDVSIDAAGLEPGAHASLLTVASQGGEERTAQVLLNLTEGSVPPQVGPAGLLFHSQDGAVPAAQQVMLSYGGDAPLAFVQAIAPAGAASWLTVTPSAGAVPAGGSLALGVSVAPASLTPGTHEATLNLEFADGSVRVVRISLLVTAGACEPTRLAPVFTRLGDHFQAKQGWPSALEVLVVDDCGNLVSEGAGVLQLSSPDEPPVTLLPGPAGLWTGTWTPVQPHGSVTATVTVESAGGLLNGTTTATGVVGPE